MVCFGHRAVDSSLSRVAATASRAVYARHSDGAKMTYLTIDADARACPRAFSRDRPRRFRGRVALPSSTRVCTQA
jgi:hypothetical protein